MLKWVVDRANGHAIGHESPLGWMPAYEDIDWRGLESFTPQQFATAMSIDSAHWKRELISHEELFVELYDRLPMELHSVRNLMLSALWRLRENWEIEHPSLGS